MHNRDLKSSGFCAANEEPPLSDGSPPAPALVHTPGPWLIAYGGLTDADQGFGIASKITPGMVAECYPPNADLGRRRRLLADARLIAAAPDLLDAAIRSLDLLEAEGRDTGEGGPLSDLRDAIDRAEGRAS